MPDVGQAFCQPPAGRRALLGSIISLYSVNPETGQALLQMTEYGDYPTENVTVRLPNKIQKARLHAIWS